MADKNEQEKIRKKMKELIESYKTGETSEQELMDIKNSLKNEMNTLKTVAKEIFIDKKDTPNSEAIKAKLLNWVDKQRSIEESPSEIATALKEAVNADSQLGFNFMQDAMVTIIVNSNETLKILEPELAESKEVILIEAIELFKKTSNNGNAKDMIAQFEEAFPRPEYLLRGNKNTEDIVAQFEEVFPHLKDSSDSDKLKFAFATMENLDQTVGRLEEENASLKQLDVKIIETSLSLEDYGGNSEEIKDLIKENKDLTIKLEIANDMLLEYKNDNGADVDLGENISPK